MKLDRDARDALWGKHTGAPAFTQRTCMFRHEFDALLSDIERRMVPEGKVLAWFIDRANGQHEVVMSPLTDDIYLDEGDEAIALIAAPSAPEQVGKSTATPPSNEGPASGSALAADEKCPDCGRLKAKNDEDCGNGLCPKWYATRDPDAEYDCSQARRANRRSDTVDAEPESETPLTSVDELEGMKAWVSAERLQRAERALAMAMFELNGLLEHGGLNEDVRTILNARIAEIKKVSEI